MKHGPPGTGIPKSYPFAVGDFTKFVCATDDDPPPDHRSTEYVKEKKMGYIGTQSGQDFAKNSLKGNPRPQGVGTYIPLENNPPTVPYDKLKRRTDEWYEKRAKFWIEDGGDIRLCGISELSSRATRTVWFGCFVESKSTVIFFPPIEPACGYPTKDEVFERVTLLFRCSSENIDGISFQSHQSRDIREAINGLGPWTEDDEKVGTDGDAACAGPTGPAGQCGGCPSTHCEHGHGENRGECRRSVEAETVHPKTLDAIIAMYEAKVADVERRYESAMQDAVRIRTDVFNQNAQLRDMLVRIADVLNGKAEPRVSESDDNTFDLFGGGQHDAAVESAEKFPASVYPTREGLEKEIDALWPKASNDDGNI